MRGGQSLSDVANRPESPYALQRLFAASALYDKAIGTSPSFILPSHFFFSNCNTGGSALLSLSIDLDDGNGYQLVTLGQLISAQYSSGGDKRVKIKMKTLDRNEYVAHFSFRVIEQSIGTRFPNTPTDIEIPATQEHSGGVMNIFINDCNDGLTKPLIIADGLDPLSRPEDDRRTWTFAIQLLNYQLQSGDVLIDQLESEGYDIIFLDYNNGGDYIQRNARMVQDALRMINQMKAANNSQEEGILLGPSMGGPVTEYALLEMEQNGESHEIEQLMLLDGVQRGANVPLSIQHAARHLHELEGPWNTPLRNHIPQLSALRNLLEEPAMRQMLLYHAFSSDGISPAPEHDQLYAELEAFADPQNFEYTALSAGSIRGVGQLVPPGATIVNYSGSLNDILTDVVGGWSGFWATSLEVVLGLLGNTANVGMILKALPDQNVSPESIYFGNIEITILFENFVSSFYTYSVSGTLPLDSSPGGMMGINRDDIGLSEQELVFNTLCIVPTVSSLDIPVNASNLYTNLEDVGSVTSSLTVLDRYAGSTTSIISTEYGPPAQENQQHNPIINDGNIDFLLFSFVTPDPLLTDGLGVINNRAYNFGRTLNPFDPDIPGFLKETENVIRYDVDIINDGDLWVNRADRIAFTDQLQNPQNQLSSNFNLYLGGSTICISPSPVTVLVGNNSRFLLGEWNQGAGITNTAHVYIQADATVDIQQDGQVEVNKASEYVVQDGGRTFVRGGGLLEARFGGAIRIEDGGEVIVESDATLRISQESALTVEPGGRLVIADGAKIQLWDGADPFGRAVLEVQGELEIQGSFEFTGNGFFDFFQGHTLSLPGGSLSIEGRGFGKRFLRLQQNADLNIGSASLVLEKGLAEFLSGSRIKVGPGGSAVVVEMDMAGSGGMSALWMEQASSLRVLDSRMDGFDAAILGDGLLPATSFDLWLVNTDFANNGFSVLLENSGLLRAWDCTFDGTQGGIGLSLANVEGARLQNCDIHHFTGNDSSPEDNTGSVGIFLEDVDELLMTGGKLRDNDIGLYCPAGSRANVVLRGQAEVADNAAYGIFIEQGQLSSTDAYGMVTMDCAKLLNNGLAGIKGQDVTLNIDAYINSQTDDPNFVRANHFQRNLATNGLWFDICYTSPLGQAIQTIPARGNYWGTDNGNPTPGNGVFYYSLDRSGTGCGGTPEISLNTALKATAAPNSCPSGPVIGPEVPLDPLCGIYAERNVRIDEDMVAALSSYFDKLDNDEETQSTYALFDVVAGVSDTVRSGASQDCRHLIDVARIFSAGQAGGGSAGQGSTAAPAKGTSSLLVFPNPASSQARLIAPYPGAFSLQVFNANGQNMAQHFFESEMTNISTKDWPEGIYYIRVSDKDSWKDWGARLLIQR